MVDAKNALVIVLTSVAVLLLAGAPTVVQACLPSERAALLEFRSKLNEPYIGALVIVLISVVVSLLAGAPTVVQACLPSDRAALLEFRSKLNEPYIGVFKTWKGQDCCKGWYGVSCDPKSRRVSGITLRGVSEEPIF
ncbi:hypothetical protein F2Q70_00006235 [Brassica cretica]|uniref:Leucine-rich repeat-containing N-terminal plant-type domain-containing protein n=1 Tax=Brassica cretica TaxID=69181 RepID=A0A8S9INY8_BRACR|nr:hypothetical protein F2Q70_00006235 [Brassica cretica]